MDQKKVAVAVASGTARRDESAERGCRGVDDAVCDAVTVDLEWLEMHDDDGWRRWNAVNAPK